MANTCPSLENENLLPQGWVLTKLNDVLLKIVGGGTPSKSIEAYYQGNIPWMTVKDMKSFILESTIDKISPEAVSNSSTNIIPAGTPIIATRMSLGKIVLANFDSAINQDLKGLFPSSYVDTNYLIYWYRSNAALIEQLGTGTTVKGIRLEILGNLNFPLPPLAEQKVIAEKLDTLLAQVEHTQTRLQRIPDILKRFRQSVLADAVSGKLTEGWRENSEYESLPLLSFTHPKSWLKTTLGKGLSYGKTQKIKPEEIKSETWILELEDIEKDTSRLIQKVNNEERKSKSTKNIFQAGDVLYGKLRPYLNKVIIADAPGACTTEIIPISSTDKLLSGFIFLWFKSPFFLNYVNKLTYGVNMPRLGTKDGQNIPILIPPLEEQTQIVTRVEQLFAYADRIEQQAGAALERVNLLSQSILAKAFRGELTAQWRAENPDLISGENSAEALLAKIQAERSTRKKGG